MTIKKRFTSFSSAPLPEFINSTPNHLQNQETRVSSTCRDSGTCLDDAIPALVRHNILHTPARELINNSDNDEEGITEDNDNTSRVDLPPSYSLLDFQDLPSYQEII